MKTCALLSSDANSFCNGILYGLLSTDFHGHQIILNAALKFNVNISRYITNRRTKKNNISKANELNYLPVKLENCLRQFG